MSTSSNVSQSSNQSSQSAASVAAAAAASAAMAAAVASSTIIPVATAQSVSAIVMQSPLGGPTQIVQQPILVSTPEPAISNVASSSTSASFSAAIDSGLIVEQTAEGDWSYDPNEPRYCICNQVSYGDMVACDNEAVSLQLIQLSN